VSTTANVGDEALGGIRGYKPRDPWPSSHPFDLIQQHRANGTLKPPDNAGLHDPTVPTGWCDERRDEDVRVEDDQH
jgi:hypothetical protein